MNDLINKIRNAQIRADENEVIKSLKAKGFDCGYDFEPDEEEITFTRDQIKQAITACLKSSGFDLQSFKEILGIE